MPPMLVNLEISVCACTVLGDLRKQSLGRYRLGENRLESKDTSWKKAAFSLWKAGTTLSEPSQKKNLQIRMSAWHKLTYFKQNSWPQDFPSSWILRVPQVTQSKFHNRLWFGKEICLIIKGKTSFWYIWICTWSVSLSSLVTRTNGYPYLWAKI